MRRSILYFSFLMGLLFFLGACTTTPGYLKNKEKIDWTFFLSNPSAIDIIEKNINWVEWHSLTKNPAIFELDYLKMSQQRTHLLEEELLQKALHPSKIQYWLENGLTVDDI